MNTDRVRSLTDGVYAIAMTILVLNFSVPQVPERVGPLLATLANMWPEFAHYVLSFLLLGVFWTIHHRQFHYIERTDSRLLWINLFVLMFIVLIPFSTSVSSEYSGVWPGPVLFDLNIFIVGILKLLTWTYATNNNLVTSDLSVQEKRAGKYKSMVTPSVAAAAIVVAFINPYWSTSTFLLIPILVPRVGAHAKRLAD